MTGERPTLPSWFPGWARQLAELYFSGSTCLFILHGNVHDLIYSPSDGNDGYDNLSGFLASQVLGTWGLVLHYDLGRGLRPLAGSDPARLRSMVQVLSARLGDPAAWPRDAESVLLLLDRFIERSLLEEEGAGRPNIGVVLEYAQHLAPAGDIAQLARGPSTNLVRLLNWAQNPFIKRVNVLFCLVAEKLAEVNSRLVQNPHVATLEVPLPDRAERERFARWAASTAGTPPAGALPPEQIADLSSGLSLVSLNVVLSQGRQTGETSDQKRFRQLKKAMIERQCQDLVEFVEPGHGLDLVVGQEAAKTRLRDDAELITQGRFEAAPMGYLLCGAVGTGKSFLAECYAGTIGIPCVKLRNFRSKYVGETEGNLEQILTVLRSLGPVIVMIDEADAALGDRAAEGDSGTSGRVFSMIASQMGDTRYRGRVVWMLLTCRPDLLPIDLKRQGRAEVHIPLFYPQGEDEVRQMFLAMARKNRVALTTESLPPLKTDGSLSGSDIEGVVLAGKRRAMAAGRADLTKADLEAAMGDFLPSTQGLEKEMQELVAVLECTQLSFLPDEWRKKISAPNGRAHLQERLVAIRQILGEMRESARPR